MSTAIFTTSMGTFKAELYTDKMPITWFVTRLLSPVLSAVIFSVSHYSIASYFFVQWKLY